jgi:hypothetical protein
LPAAAIVLVAETHAALVESDEAAVPSDQLVVSDTRDVAMVLKAGKIRMGRSRPM